jgi:hypothetical protein
MSDVLVKDILLKAAEDVQSGMWCKGDYFREAPEVYDGTLFSDDLIDAALASHRCAEGSLMVATKLLGGTRTDWMKTSTAVSGRLRETGYFGGLIGFNDENLPDDPFEAGQILAELFRSTAEAL